MWLRNESTTERADNIPGDWALSRGLPSLFTDRRALFHAPRKMSSRPFLQRWSSVCQMNICGYDCSGPRHQQWCSPHMEVTPLLSRGHNEELIALLFARAWCWVCKTVEGSWDAMNFHEAMHIIKTAGLVTTQRFVEFGLSQPGKV